MKLRKSFLIIVCTTLLAFVATGAYAEKGETKIGFVDLSRLFDEYYKTKEYDKVLEAKHAEFKKESDVKLQAIQEAQGRIGLLKEEEKKKLEDEMEKMRTDLLEFDRQRKTDMRKERNEKIREILLEIEKIVSDYADKEGYSIILNDKVLIYGNQSHNLTEMLLKNLNEGQAEK